MTNKKIWMGMLAMALVFGITVSSCSDGGGGSGGGGGGGGSGGSGGTGGNNNEPSQKKLVITNIPETVKDYRYDKDNKLVGGIGIYPAGTTHAQTLKASVVADNGNKVFSTSGSGPYTFTIPLYNNNPTRWDSNPDPETPWTGNGTYDIFIGLPGKGDGGHTYLIKNVSFSEETTTVQFSNDWEITTKYEDFNYVDAGSTIVISGYFGDGGAVSIPSYINEKPVIELYGWEIFGEKLTSVTFGADSKLESIRGGVFNNTKITTITIPDSVTYINNFAFGGCTGLTSITIPKSVKTIEGWGAFTGCTNLATVTFETGSQLETIGGGTFAGCTSLTTITIPKTVKTIIGWGVFEGCTKLATVTFEADSQLKSISGGAFINCNLSDITIPTSVTSIDGGAFQDNPLTSVTIGANVTLGGWSPFPGNLSDVYNNDHNKEAGTYKRDSVDDDDWYLDI